MDTSSTRSRWYVAVLVVRARVGEASPEEEHLLDQQVRLIHAVNAEAAYSRALALGTVEAQSYRNGDGEEVQWEFAGLADLQEVQASELSDGVEVYNWLRRGRSEDAVLPKDKLAVFWTDANRGRRADELLK